MCQAGLIEDCSCHMGTPVQFPPGDPGCEVTVTAASDFDSGGQTCETDPFLPPRQEEREEEEPASRWSGQQYCPGLPQVMEELRKLMGIAGPMAALNGVVYLRAMVSVLCLGQLGGLQLAGGALSIGFTNITGYAVLNGLASGMDSVCNQAYGYGNRAKVGLTLQRTILILLTACLPISLLWLNLERILLALGQNPNITMVASMYCLYSLPDLLANSFLQPLRICLKSQGQATPMLWCSAAAVVIHIPLNILLVFVLDLGVPGVAIAAVWTNFNMVFFILGYLWYSGALRETSVPWSTHCLREWWPLLSLALPSCLGVCLEWWWYEIITILAGYLPDPQVAVATTGIVIQTTSLMYAFPHALSASVSTRVGNELGAGRPSRARMSACVALGCAFLFGMVSLTWTIALRNTWGHVFTDEKSVLALTAAVMPLMGVCELGNCPQTIGVGVLRGQARPAIGARINFGSFYLVGTPVAVASAFWYKLGFQGLWYGLLAAQIACAASVLFVVLRSDWAAEAHEAKIRSMDVPVKPLSNKVVPVDFEHELMELGGEYPHNQPSAQQRPTSQHVSSTTSWHHKHFEDHSKLGFLYEESAGYTPTTMIV